jgi:hypothetical protein
MLGAIGSGTVGEGPDRAPELVGSFELGEVAGVRQHLEPGTGDGGGKAGDGLSSTATTVRAATTITAGAVAGNKVPDREQVCDVWSS